MPAKVMEPRREVRRVTSDALAGVCQRTSVSKGAALGCRAQWHQLQHCPQLWDRDRRRHSHALRRPTPTAPAAEMFFAVDALALALKEERAIYFVFLAM